MDKPIENQWLDREDWWWALECQRRELRLRAMLSEKDPAVLDSVLKAEIQLCKYDPCHWIDNYGWMENPKAKNSLMRDVPSVLWPVQRELVKFFLSGLENEKPNQANPRLVIKGRELGVSWIATMLVYNLFREEDRFRAKFGSRKENLVDGDEDSIFAKLRYLHRRQPSFLHPPTVDRRLKFYNAATHGEITGESVNAGFGRGGRRRILVLDEFAHVDPEYLQARIWTSIQSVASTIWLPSSPKGPGNKFAQLLSDLPADCVFEMDYTSDPRKDEEWRRGQLETMSEEEFEQEHGARIVTLRSGKVFTPRKALVEYWDEEPDFVQNVKPKLARLPLVGGWDFGSGASLLVCLFAVVEMREQVPHIWIDRELVWKQTSWRQAGTDCRAVMGLYGDRHVHFGDPAGRSPESDQYSWETNLRSAGIPLMCLPDYANTREGIEWGVKMVGSLLAEGRLHVHRRCEYLWSCLDNWRRDVPEGITLDVVSRSYIPPRHDQYSHGGMALLYLIHGILKAVQSLGTSRDMQQEQFREEMKRVKPVSKGILEPDRTPRGMDLIRSFEPGASGIFPSNVQSLYGGGGGFGGGGNGEAPPDFGD